MFLVQSLVSLVIT